MKKVSVPIHYAVSGQEMQEYDSLSKARPCSLSNYTKGALLYGVFPVCASSGANTPDTLNVRGRFASLRSEQGAGLACRLGRCFKAFHALRSPPETRPPLRRYAAILADHQ